MAVESPAAAHVGWETSPVYFGRLGVNLTKALELLSPEELARCTNAIPRQGGGIDTAPGLTQVATGGANIHSAFRLNDPNAATFTRFWGVDATWGRAAIGAIGVLEAGFSGNPLSWVVWQSELTGTPWIYVADSLKMRKATRTSGSLQIGLAKPPQPAVAAVGPKATYFATFTAADNTAAANWTTWSGRAVAPATGNPGAFAVTNGAPPSIDLNTSVGTVAAGGYYSAAFLGAIRDLSVFPDATTISDDDIMHLTMLWDRPDIISEVRIYFVVGAAFFNEAALPGDTTALNGNAYMRSLTPAEYSTFIAGQQGPADASAAIQQANFLANQQNLNVTDASAPSAVSLVGANKFFEFGTIGLPVRRSDFLKIGFAGSAGFTWANVRGMVVSVHVTTPTAVRVSLSYGYMVGGNDPDTSEPDAFPYDYRVTNNSKSSGAESNPSDPMVTTLGVGGVEALRTNVQVTPVAAGDADIFQRAYRRGGTISDDWYFVAENAADGAVIDDLSSDLEALAAGAVATDHDQPVTTTDAAGAAVLAQPVPIIFGPINGFMFALGDPNRPGDYYWCLKDEPDHWPSSNHETACPPSEQLMNGGRLAEGQGFVFSRQRLYAISVSDSGPSSSPTSCAKGLAGRWAMAIGPGGIFFVARSEAVYGTTGSTPDEISDNIRPLFKGQTVQGYNPVDWTQENALRLSIVADELWFGFQDTAGARVWWVYHLIYKTWRFRQFAVPTSLVYFEPNEFTQAAQTIIGGTASGKAYTNTGLSDDGTLFTGVARTGALTFGRDREEKLLGDVALWANMFGSNLTITPYFNGEKTAGAPTVGVGNSVYNRYIFDIFGAVPYHASSLSLDLQWSASLTGAPFLAKYGVAVAIQPEVTMQRATTWEPLNEKGEAYVTGCWIDCDTGGAAITVRVEGLISSPAPGAPTQPQLFAIQDLIITSTQGRKVWYSWGAVKVDMIRLRPTDVCAPWMLFGQGWISDPEPPRIQIWDTNFENLGDSYCTGLDLEVDTFGAVKSIDIYVDGVAVQTTNITANGRRFVHVTMTPIRGHIFRFQATDSNLGLLYTHKWITEPEPGEQTNWNQNFTIAGTLADKYLKGFIVECDTFGVNKSVNVEVDGVAIAGSPFTVNANGRKVVQVSFTQVLGRVFRLLPTDGNPGRLYSMAWIFDEEPLALTRFETQEEPNDISGFQIPTSGQITLKSTAQVNMRVITYGQNGLALDDNTYALPSTAGVKSVLTLNPFLTPQKGLLTKFVFTSASGFWLYREESWLEIQPWAGGQVQTQRPFGNDDLDPARAMRSAALTAARGGGAAAG